MELLDFIEDYHHYIIVCSLVYFSICFLRNIYRFFYMDSKSSTDECDTNDYIDIKNHIIFLNGEEYDYSKHYIVLDETK